MNNIGENAKGNIFSAMRKNHSARMLWDGPCPFLCQRKYFQPSQSPARKQEVGGRLSATTTSRLRGLQLVLLLFKPNKTSD